MSSNQFSKLAGKKAKGKRPQYFDDPAVERNLSIIMAVAGELAVARERIDTLECLLEEKGIMVQKDVEQFTPTHEQAQKRGNWHQEYIARILRHVQQEHDEIEELNTQKDS